MAINASWNFVNFRAGLIRSLVAAGHEVVAIAPDRDYERQIRALGCDFVLVPMNSGGTSPFEDALLTARFVGVLRRHRIDVFLGFTPKPNIYGGTAARLLGIAAIANVAGLGVVFAHPGALQRLVLRLYRVALRRAKTVFFQNADDARLMEGNNVVRPDQWRLLPGSGVDLAAFAPPPEGTVRDPAAPVFVLVARLLWAKGIGEYVAAARAVRRSHPHARFQLLGFVDPSNPSAIPLAQIEAWQDEGVIEFLGRADDVRPWIAAADCVVLPTFYPEGTPRVLLEAAAMARPLIATDVTGCRDIVRDGENGFLVPPRDVDALAHALGRMITLGADGRAAMGAAARRTVEAGYDEAIVIREYAAAIASYRA